MSVYGMTSVTVGVSDMDESLGLFRDVMGLQVESDGEAPRALLDAWGLPEHATARLVELSCRGYPVGHLRLAQYSPAPSEAVRLDHGPGAMDSSTDIGPKAIDFYVPPPMTAAVDAITGAGYAFRSEPIYYEVGDLVTEECLFSGPDGVPALLMLGHRHPPESMRELPSGVPFSEIATTSVICSDPEAARHLYCDALGLEPGTDAWVPEENLDLARRLTGVRSCTGIHFLLVCAPGEPSGKLLFVHFAGVPIKRLAGRMRPGKLGVNLFSYTASDLDATLEKACEAGGTLLRGPAQVGETRVALLLGANEELLELTEEG
ncbi:MAG: VOC family protein [Gammaproteobacteria bacterium]|nr:VOC family protein [Gammaproteobacteria bacterium]MYF57718.1 VOC family protein [Gammaproteobacteria bacterium]